MTGLGVEREVAQEGAGLDDRTRRTEHEARGRGDGRDHHLAAREGGGDQAAVRDQAPRA